MDIGITSNIECGAGCRFCPQPEFIKAYKETCETFIPRMTFGIFKTCVDKIPEDTVLCHGGFNEPFRHPRFIDFLEYASGQGYTQDIYTTLLGANEKDIDRLIEIKNIRAVTIHLPDQTGNFTYDPDEHYLNVVRKIHKSKINKCYVINNEGVPFHEFFNDKVFEILYNDISWVLHPIHDRAGNLKDPSLVNEEGKRKGIINCMRLKSGMLLPDGRVTLCCQDWKLRHILGNLLEKNYEELFLGEEFELVRGGTTDEMKDVLCRDCYASESFM